jgi:site-specific DNA-methyltransferase (adenine-specific)
VPLVKPYYSDGTVTLYLGDMRDVVPRLPAADLVLADPPYDETSLEWDRWPDGWPTVVAESAPAMWCFGSLRMFMDRRDQFGPWKYSQDVVWEKHNGSGFATDRFKRVHEQATFWYQGPWSTVRHEVPTTADATPRQVRRKQRPPHMGSIDRSSYVTEDGGPRLMRSVVFARSMHGRAIHPTEKPCELLIPLITYACPPGGSVLDPFAGSGSTAEAARLLGRKAVLVEGFEPYCEAIANRMSQSVLPIGGVA